MRIQYVPTRSSLDLLSPELIGNIEQYLEQCATAHSKCTKFQNMGSGQPQKLALPARLLEISGLKQDKNVHLVETHNANGETLKYAALSYCWGTADFIKTTEDCYCREHAHQDTCEDLKNVPCSNYLHAIQWSKLPQGFQDAIELCWEAGIRYLWIDSLCIIQGNQQDWNRESARMKDIYMGAFLTIVLASTDSPLEGALSTRREFTAPISVLLSHNGISLGSYLIEPTMYTSDIFEIESPVTKPWKHANKAIYDSRWRARGWTFQESYLPARKIYICEGRIHFSCKTHSRLEGLPGEFPPLDRLVDGDEDEDENQDYLQWYTWVQHYTQRELTEPFDKLPAISALASRKGRTSNNRYLAGIWENDLEAGLLWHRRAFKYGEASSTAHPLHRSLIYRAPSWSWSAYDGPVTFLAQYYEFGVDSQSEIELLEASCPRANPNDPYGRLASLDKAKAHGGKAYLRLRAKVVSVVVQKKARFHSGGRRDFDQDAAVKSDHIEFQGYSGIDCREEWGDEDWKQTTALLVCTSERFGKSLRVGLLLRKVNSESKETEYERVGSFYDNEDEDNFGFDQQKLQEICLV